MRESPNIHVLALALTRSVLLYHANVQEEADGWGMAWDDILVHDCGL